MARRFIVESNDIKKESDNVCAIYGSEAHHINVLRHKIGDDIIINKYICEILDIKKDCVKVKIKENAKSFGEAKTDLTLFIAYLKGEKMDFVIQKAVELGVKQIVPFFSKNVVVKLDKKDYPKKLQKFSKIVDEACKQCGRTDNVNIENILTFDEMINQLKNYDTNIFAYEKSHNSLKEVLREKCDSKMKISCIIGPEGGFMEKEAEIITSLKNTEQVSISTRILRAETAAISTCAIILYEMEG